MRLDIYLASSGLCESRSKAQNIINNGRVSVDGNVVTKASYDVSGGQNVTVAESDVYEFVGRGGNKLEHSFSKFNFSAEGKVCLDIGASTGGFTECLLLHGASYVYAVDSGTGQLAKTLLADNRVKSIEGFNARNLTTDNLDGKRIQLVVMDVSFISQKLLYPAILRVAGDNCDVITLIKPQFEAGKQAIGKKGIVKDPKIRKKVVEDVILCAKEMGFEFMGLVESPITGGDGNVEYLLHLKVK